jgi:hypothetical protein
LTECFIKDKLMVFKNSPMLKYWQKRQRQKLFQQWVKQGELPPEEVSPEQEGTEMDLDSDNVSRGRTSEYAPNNIEVDGGTVRLPVRYVLIAISIVTLLLVTLSVAITLLIIRS